jgi:hypothetical protein
LLLRYSHASWPYLLAIEAQLRASMLLWRHRPPGVAHKATSTGPCKPALRHDARHDPGGKPPPNRAPGGGAPKPPKPPPPLHINCPFWLLISPRQLATSKPVRRIWPAASAQNARSR